MSSLVGLCGFVVLAAFICAGMEFRTRSDLKSADIEQTKRTSILFGACIGVILVTLALRIYGNEIDLDAQVRAVVPGEKPPLASVFVVVSALLMVLMSVITYFLVVDTATNKRHASKVAKHIGGASLLLLVVSFLANTINFGMDTSTAAPIFDLVSFWGLAGSLLMAVAFAVVMYRAKNRRPTIQPKR